MPVSVLTQGSTELPQSAYSSGAVIISLDASTTPADFSQEVTQTLFLWDWYLPHVRSCKSAADCLGYYREVSGVFVWWMVSGFFRSAGARFLSLTAHHRLFMILWNSQHLQSFNGIFFSLPLYLFEAISNLKIHVLPQLPSSVWRVDVVIITFVIFIIFIMSDSGAGKDEKVNLFLIFLRSPIYASC